ncbi:MAG TPA: hypothetical protein VFP12_16015 [Allosphingosinicella sp.]|nr:hypothetical protein [Allosphingosinicella sp.]
MLTPSDFVALFSAMVGSAYGAFKNGEWPDTYSFRLVQSLQTSMVFLLAFAGMDYLRTPLAAKATPGVKWTESMLTTSLPVVIYLPILLLLLMFIFHSSLFIVRNKRPAWLESRPFLWVAVLVYVLIGYHALTIDISPVNLGAL